MRIIERRSAKQRSILSQLALLWPQRAEEFMELMSTEESIVITVNEFEPGHTSEQQGYYWMGLNAWGAHLGFTAHESELILHNSVLCSAYGTKRTIKRAGSDGSIVVDVPNERSSSQSIKAYSLLIEHLLRMAAEDGYVIPDPRFA